MNLKWSVQNTMKNTHQPLHLNVVDMIGQRKRADSELNMLIKGHIGLNYFLHYRYCINTFM